jgi:protease-4
LLLDDMGNGGMAKLREVAAALERFKASGKQVIAWGSVMEQRQYFLAAHASEVYLHPFGTVVLTGFGGYRGYYHDALEHLGITVHVYRVGKYKSAVEPFTSNGPSKEAAEAEAFYLNEEWAGFTGELEALRHLPSGAISGQIAQAPERLAAAGGSLAQLALEEKLVDGLKTRDELRALLLQRGKPDAEHKTFRQISFADYRSDIAESGDRSRQVGIVVAEGLITDGNEPQGAIGGRSTSELIRKAREDSNVKALVLRVDSRGGSAFGSELIRRELELVRAAGKPVVVSMSDVAASGGYWISTAADRVIADPATITGSIGVFGAFPTAERTMDKLGIHTGGVTTAWPAGAADLRRPVDSRLGSVIQSTVEHIYRQFLAHVSEARQMAPEKVDEIAQGRVWTGKQARERGLVDDLGGLRAAVQMAASLAKLGDGYRPTYIEVEAKGWSQFLPAVPGAALRWAAGQAGLALPFGGALRATSEQVQKDLSWLMAKTPGTGSVLTHCLCQVP